ncbi:hypothetical protein TNCV_4352371 [Trichonephila clavipes]|nr:hypothetical protein TNCV_4352371 [Trichonephila clavipes]
MPHDWQRPDQGPRNLSWQRAKSRLSLAIALSTVQVTERFSSVLPQFRGKTPWGWSGAFHLPSHSTNLMRGLASRWLFKVPPCHEGTINLQTSMSSPGLEPSRNGTAVSVAIPDGRR